MSKQSWNIRTTPNDLDFIAWIEDICCIYKSAGMKTARLIAAAPEMLEALKSTLPIIQDDINLDGPCEHDVNICICGLINEAEKISSIIRKIEGKE